MLKYLVAFLLSLVAFTSFSSPKAYFKKSEYRISILNAGIGMPPHLINGRFQLGSEGGLYHPFKFNEKKRGFDYTLGLGYFAHRSLQRNMFIKPGLGYFYYMNECLRLRMALHSAFMWTRQTNDEFKFIGNGQYKKVNRSRFQMMPTIALESNFNLFKKGNFQIGGLLKYEFGTQVPFSNLSNILPINQLHIGMTFKKL